MLEQKSRVCNSCGNRVTGENYICVPDPQDPNKILYYCSRGKCKPRKDSIPKVRKDWLKIRGKQ